MSADPAPTAERPRLFLIDGYSNIFRAFYAIQTDMRGLDGKRD